MRARSRGPAGTAVGRGERARALPASRGPGVRRGVGNGGRSAPRPPLSLRTHWRAVTACGAGTDGGGGSGSGPAVLLTPQPARWRRAARDLGRTLPGGVGSREAGVSSHPPGWPRGGPGRGGTGRAGSQWARGPRRVPFPRSRPAQGLGRLRGGSGGEEGGGQGVGTSEGCGQTSVRVCWRGSGCRQLGTHRAGVPAWGRVRVRARGAVGSSLRRPEAGVWSRRVRAVGWWPLPGTMASEAGLRPVGQQTVLGLPLKWLRQSA